MRKTFNKHLRDNLESTIQKRLKGLYPHFNMQAQYLRIPSYPRIVLYSNIAQVDKFMQNFLPPFLIINPAPLNLSDEEITRKVALQVIAKSTDSNAVIVQGFPLNTSQALMLDKFLGGVNLAMHIKGNEQVDYSSLLNYYDERGALIELDYKENVTVEEAEHMKHNVYNTMKEAL